MTRASVKHLAKDLHLVVIPFIAYFCCVVAHPIVYPSTQVPGSPLRFVPLSAGFHRADFPLLLCFATEPKSTHLFLNRGAVASSPASSATHPATEPLLSRQQRHHLPPPRGFWQGAAQPARWVCIGPAGNGDGKNNSRTLPFFFFFLSIRLSSSSYSNSKTIPSSFFVV